MIELRRSGERGHANHGWLDTRHTFSFASYWDPRYTGFRSLLVINEDRVAPGTGFPTHAHSDMEILSYVLEGAIEHKDSTGSGQVLRPGEVQRMTAGRGIAHSELNPSPTEPLHFLQIWILPERKRLAPGYEQKAFPEAERLGKLRLVASRDGAEGSLTVHQDVRVYASLLDPGSTVELPLAPGRYAWVQLARGAIDLNGQALEAGDGAALSDEPRLTIAATGRERAELLVFDLA